MTTATTSGVYAVMLFREDMSGVYLTFNQGVTQPKNRYGATEGLSWLRDNAARLRQYCDELSEFGFHLDSAIDLQDVAGRGKDYENSTIAHKFYPRGQVPSDEVMLDEVEAVLRAYDAYIDDHEGAMDTAIDIVEVAKGPEVAALSSEDRRVWLIAPGPGAEHWEEFYRDGIIAIGWDDLGDLTQYPSLGATRDAIVKTFQPSAEPKHDALACFEFAHVIQPGDLVIAKKGRRTIVGYGTVTGDYVFDEGRSYYRHTRKVRWEGRGEWSYDGLLVTKTITEIGKFPSHAEELKRLVGLIEDKGPAVAPETERTPYDIDDALAGLFLSRKEFEELIVLWRHKKNLILQGPPGVGKTFVSRRLAYALMGYRDPSRLGMVQFHQSYSYEDFIQGYRPSGEGFSLKDGLFYEFCERAARDQTNRYVFIIDEVNRGNLSKIFGEILMLIESDKRGSEWSIPLTYASSSEVQFYVPENLFLLGMMNTADRSLAVVDYALRRRFAFVTLTPRYDDEKFLQYHAKLNVAAELTKLIRDRMKELNTAIANDTINLGPGFQIGHSFFTPAPGEGPFDEAWYRRVVQTEIVPLLEEYWFDNPERVTEWRNRLLG